jgi:1-acyl-sn-glycerol-3-phosphate acyltransferase
VALGILLIFCFAVSLVSRIIAPDTPERRARWNHWGTKLVLRLLGIRLTIKGTPPASGLLVANHLSYLDILVFGAALPCYLVSKAEVSRWPMFGSLARSGGTMFVDRSSKVSAEQVTEEIAERLRGPIPVLFFPEGTSTDGLALLRFHSRLYTPAVEGAIPVTSAAVRYMPEGGWAEKDLCWYGDDLFTDHVWKVLGGPKFSAEIWFGEPKFFTDRRVAADETFVEIETMRAEMMGNSLQL